MLEVLSVIFKVLIFAVVVAMFVACGPPFIRPPAPPPGVRELPCGFERWPTPPLTVAVDDNAVDLKIEIAMAAKLWHQKLGVRLFEWARTDDGRPVDVIIQRGEPRDGDGAVRNDWLGACAPGVDNGHPYAVVTLSPGIRKVQMVDVIAHELGHVLGLAHTEDRYSIMYPGGHGGRTIQKADVEVVKRLHGL